VSLIVSLGLGSSGVGEDFVATAVDPFDERLEVTLNHLFSVTGPAADPASYAITSIGAGVAASVTSVAVDGYKLVLYCTEQTNGEPYRLTLPDTGIVDEVLNAFQGPFDLDYDGAGAAPELTMVRVVDARTLEVVFSERPNRDDALDPDNYSITGPDLAVEAVEYVTDFVYRLTTARQEPGESYDIEVSGIRDA